MGMQDIVVIGIDKNVDENPLAYAFDYIGKQTNKMRVFVTTLEGTFEYGQETKKMTPTVDCVKTALDSTGKDDCRLLLFDAVSCKYPLNPVSGLLVWHQYYCSRNSETNINFISFDKIIDVFFSQATKGVWWTGFLEPKDEDKDDKYWVKSLAKDRWDRVMGDLAHIIKHRGEK